MKITEISIKSFGKLRGVKITPIDGANIIYGENESGKSTIMAFILCMLFGMDSPDQRHRYAPWSGGKIIGQLTFEHGGSSYVLARQFGITKSADRTELVRSGERVELPDGAEPGEHILGISKETFMNSVYIGQAGTAINGDNTEILNKLANLAAVGDETASKSEITSRLNDAAAVLRSRQPNAVLPALEKQRMELLEERAVIVNRTAEADKLRDEITRLTHRRDRLEKEFAIMKGQSSVLSDIRTLEQYDDILRKKAAYDLAKEKFETLHNAMFSGKGGLDSKFLSDAQGLLDGYNGQQAAIRVKQEQLESIDKKLEKIDREPLSKMRIIKKHVRDISAALDDYNDLKQRRAGLERQLEEKAPVSGGSTSNTVSALIIGIAVVIICILLGTGKNPIWYVIAILALLITLGYIYFSRKGVSFEGLPKDNLQLQNINSEMREINRSMRPVLDEMDVSSMDELDSALHEIDGVHSRITDLQREKESALEEITALRQELAGILQQLKDKLYPYKAISSDTEAVKIISVLSKAQCEHAALEASFQAEEASYLSALGEQEYEIVYIEAEELREKLGKNASLRSDSFDSSLDENIEKCRNELETVRTELARREGELSQMNSDPQSLNKLTDEIKLVTSRIDRYEFEYNAIQEATDALNIAYESMQKDFRPIINFRASRIVESLTGQRYSSVLVSDDLNPSVAAPGDGSIRSASCLSAGTVDQIYLALRLAISGVLSQENLPLLLDDAFAQYDDRRMTDALKYIVAENSADRLGQIILFTCHDRVIYAAKECGILNGIVRLK